MAAPSLSLSLGERVARTKKKKKDEGAKEIDASAVKIYRISLTSVRGL